MHGNKPNKKRPEPVKTPERRKDQGVPSPSDLVSLGRVIKPHGLRGQVKVNPLNGNPERFEELRVVYLEYPDGEISRVEVEKVKTQGGVVTMRFAGIDDRTAAESLAGCWISVHREDIPCLEENSYYTFDLIGMEVTDPEGNKLGTVARIDDYPANAVLVVESESEEIWIPALKELVLEVDMESKRMTVRLPEGLPTYPKQGG